MCRATTNNNIINSTGHESITSAKIVYVDAFNHGYDHDDAEKNQKPKYKEIEVNMWKAMAEYWPRNEDGPGELWQPYYEELAKRILQALKHSDKIVLTDSPFRQNYRDFVLNKLEEGGLSTDKMIAVKLKINQDVYCDAYHYGNPNLVEFMTEIEKHRSSLITAVDEYNDI